MYFSFRLDIPPWSWTEFPLLVIKRHAWSPQDSKCSVRKPLVSIFCWSGLGKYDEPIEFHADLPHPRFHHFCSTNCTYVRNPRSHDDNSSTIPRTRLFRSRVFIPGNDSARLGSCQRLRHSHGEETRAAQACRN